MVKTNDIEICGERARPRGPGGSMTYQFVLNVVAVRLNDWIPHVEMIRSARENLARGSLK